MIEWGVSLTDQVSAPAKSAQGGLTDLASSFEGLGPYAQAAGVAIGLATAAVLAVSAALYEGGLIAIEASDAYEDLATQLSSLADGAATGEELIATLDDLSLRLPKTRDQLADWAADLLAAGESADSLSDTLTAMASAEALMGKNGKQAAEQFKGLMLKILEAEQTTGKLKLSDKTLTQLAKTGANVSDVAAEMGLTAETLRNQLKAGTTDAAKFGDALQAALTKKGAGALAGNLTDLPVLADKAKASFIQLFEGVDTSGFMSAAGELVGIFDKSSASGKTLKWVVTSVFNALFTMGQRVLPYVHLFFLKLVNAGLRIYIVFKPVIKQFGELWDQVDAGKGSIGLVDTFINGLVVMANIMAFVATVSATLWSGIFWWIGTVWEAAKGLISWLRANLSSDEGESLSGSLIDGLVAGLTGGQDKVINKMIELAKNALGAAKKTLGIASDSKEMIKLGKFSAGGFASGLDQGGQAVEAAASDMGARAMEAAPAPAASVSSGGGLTINVQPGAIVIQGAADVLALTEEALVILLERIALSQGLGGTSTP